MNGKVKLPGERNEVVRRQDIRGVYQEMDGKNDGREMGIILCVFGRKTMHGTLTLCPRGWADQVQGVR